MYRETAERMHGHVCHYVREKAKNVLPFWYAVAAILVVCLALYYVGSCLGCEACFECGACVDDSCSDCLDCELEECGREAYKSGGCYDCQYDSVKLVYPGGQTYEMEVSQDKKSFGSYYWKNGYSETYWQAVGMYGEDGSVFVDASGNLKKDLDKTDSLYVKYKEKDLGVSYTLYFGDDDLALEPMSVVVGDLIDYSQVPERPAADGRVCVGWQYNGNRLFSYDENNNATGTYSEFHLYNIGKAPGTADTSIELTPVWENITYTVNFSVKGQVIQTVSFNYGDALGTYANGLSSETLAQYGLNASFLYWSLDANGEDYTQITDSYEVKKNITLYAVIEEYVGMRFYYKDGTNAYEDKVATVGRTFADFPIVEENRVPGMEFTGWYESEEDANLQRNPQTSVYSVTESKTFYGGWKSVSYTIDYYNENSLSFNKITSESYNYGETVVLYGFKSGDEKPSDQPGYNFVGWQFGDPETGEPYGDLLTQLPSNTYGNLKLVAKYEAKQYKIKLSASLNGTISKTEVTVTYGEEFTLPVPSYNADKNVEFDHWYYHNELTNQDVVCTDENGNSLFELTFENLGFFVYSSDFNESDYDTNGFEFWDECVARKMVVTFRNDAGDAYADNTPQAKQRVTQNTRATKPADPEKTGYSFVGWFVSLDDNAAAFDFNSAITTDTSIYAKFVPQEITVTLQANQGKFENGTSVSSQMIVYDTESYTLEVPTRAEYKFLGYKLSGQDDSNRITDGNGKSFGSFEMTGAPVLEAVWERVEYKIVLKGHNNTADVTIIWTKGAGTTSIDYDNDATNGVTIPTKETTPDHVNDYVFMGWSKAENDKRSLYFDAYGALAKTEMELLAFADSNGKITLHAIWL